MNAFVEALFVVALLLPPAAAIVMALVTLLTRARAETTPALPVGRAA